METFDSTWVEMHIAETIETWRDCSHGTHFHGECHDASEHDRREKAYDEALETIEADSKGKAKGQLVSAFGRFASRALNLEGEAVDLLSHDFLPIGTKLGRWARRFDPNLSMNDVIQAARNAWTACGLQPLLGENVALTPALFGYSLIYPYSDNYLDDAALDAAVKSEFSRRFRRRLLGEAIAATNDRECALWKLVALIEKQFPRSRFPTVFECLLAIHAAQEQSLHQLCGGQRDSNADVLRMSCAKGGASVLSDACLIRGWLTPAESRFAFEWGVLLQLGDDLQDLRDDMRRGSSTLFSLAVASGEALDGITLQLLRFGERVGRRMDELPAGTATLKELLKLSWRSLIIRAIADSHQYFSPSFVREAERRSPFRFQFLRQRSERLAGRHGLYESIFSELISDDTGCDHDSPEARFEWSTEQATPITLFSE